MHAERLPAGTLNRADARSNERGGEVIQHIDSHTSYLRISLADPDDVSRLFDEAGTAENIVIDLRGYPKAGVGQQISSRLIDRPTPFVTYTFVDFNNPGAFWWSAPQSIEPAGKRFSGNVALLVDENTVSAGEFTAMAIQASPRVVTVGSETAGADGNMSAIPIPGGFVAAMSGIGIFYPDGRPTQRVGIKIDILCKPTIEGIRSGRDEVLECALDRLKGQKQ